DLADTVRKAFYIANEGRKGPVLIDIPKDITAAVTDYEKKTPAPVINHNPDDINEQIDRAAELIRASEKPFIYAGGGIVSCNAEGALGEFVSRIDAPIALSLMGQAAYYNKDPRYVGMLGMHGTKTASLALAECDLMIVLGSRFSDRVALNTKTFAKHTKVIHVEIDPAEIGKNVKPDCYVNGDLKYVLSRLNDTLEQKRHPEWISKITEWQKKYALSMAPIHDVNEVLPDYVIKTLNDLTDAKAVITTEVGQHQMWAAQFYDFTEPRTFASSGGLGTMGYGLGASIGAKVGNPDKTVVNIAGDGSFFMNCNELSTLAKHQIPVIELVFTNNVLGMVRQWQRIFYDKRFSQTTLDRGTDYMKLAEAFGIEGVRITSKEEVRSGLKKAIECGKPCLVECVIDKDVNVLPMVPAGGDVLKPIMEISLD
ncbi:MAG: acetolactate synthase large subunit, partial [Ruminococcus sp.]|nr:acetolactate synthase large subunit [Ruminococcus sp.]